MSSIHPLSQGLPGIIQSFACPAYVLNGPGSGTMVRSQGRIDRHAGISVCGRTWCLVLQ